MSTLNSVTKILCLLLVVTSFSCARNPANSLKDPMDTTSDLTFSEIQEALTKKPEKKSKKDKKSAASAASAEAPIPSSSKLIITPPPPVIGGDKIISFSVTDQVPLKDVLIELGRMANIDIDLDSTISGGVIINAKNRPLKEVIDRIATQANLRYSYKNGVLFFERDTPYMKNYFVDYLSSGTLWADVSTNITSLLTPSDTSDDEDSSTSSFTLNKSAGIISVFATDKQHEVVTKYLAAVEKYASAQVLIEAKVVEVTLNKQFSAGIDWSWAGGGGTSTIGTSGTFGVGDITDPYLSANTGSFRLFGLNGSISGTIKALEQFGNTKALSSPRITAMNNQKAFLDFSENLIYFTISTSASTVAGNTNPTTTSSVTATKNEVPIGVQLSITPSINVATNEVTLDIQPKLSVDSGREAIDPSVNPETGESLGNRIPIIKTRTLKTLAKIQSGNILVIGGLMTDTTANTDTGIPFLSHIPILGYLFKYTSKSTEIVETVIFIKATIVNSGGTVGKDDRDLQQKFDTNKRAFF